MMKKKIMAVCIVGLFLTMGLTILPVSGMKANVETKPKPTTGVVLVIQVIRQGPPGQWLPVQGVFVTVQNKNIPLIKRTLMTGAFGSAKFFGLPDGTYTLKMSFAGKGMNTEIEYSFLNSVFGYKYEDFEDGKSKSLEHRDLLLQRFIENFPLLQQLLNRPVFQQLP